MRRALVALMVAGSLAIASPADAASQTVKFTTLTSPVTTGANATATVKTSANAHCTIKVVYKNGPSKASGLTPKNANGTGVASWTWKVATNTTPGSWPVTVRCTKGTAVAKATKKVKVIPWSLWFLWLRLET
jgi:hypothetical protein